MQRVWHQLGKDLRQFRWSVALWGALLGVDLAFGWLGPGAVRYAPLQGFHGGAVWLAGAVVTALWYLAVALPVMVNYTDHPGRDNAWLRTRPLSPGTLLAAKAAFAILVILLPALFQEAVRLVTFGLPGGLVFRAVAERALLLVPAVVAASAFGWLWATPRQIVVGLGVLGAAAWGTFLVLVLLSELLPAFRGRINDPDYARQVVGLLVLAVTLGLLAWRNHRARWRLVRRLTWVGLAGIGTLLVAFVPVWDLFPIRPTSTTAGLTGNERVTVPADSVSTTVQITEGEAGARYGIQFKPEISDRPHTMVVEWGVTRAEAVTPEGSVPFAPAWFRRNLYGFRNGATADDLRAFDPLLGNEAIFVSDFGSGTWEANTWVSGLDPAKLPARPFRVRADLTGNLFRWRLAARLPLREGAEARDAAGQWKVIGLNESLLPANPNLYVGLRRDQVALQTAGQAALRQQPYWPSGRCEFLLFDPATKVAVLPPFPSISALALGEHSGYEHRFLILQFDLRSLVVRSWATSQPDSLELIIFERDYVGSIAASVETATVILPDTPVGAGVDNLVRPDEMTLPEFRRRIAALRAPAPEAGRFEVGRYVAEVLQLTEARRHYAQAEDPLVGELARYVPKHASLLLEALPVTGQYAQQILREALEQGLSDAQAGLVIDALPTQPDLAALIVRRGWIEPARATLLRMAEACGPLNLATIQALAWLDDPQTHARLLATFEHRPNLDVYEVLRVLPSVEAALEQSLDRLWKERARAVQPEHQAMPELAVLLRAGHPEALAFAMRIAKLVPPNQRARLWPLLDDLRQGVLIEGLTPDENRRPEAQAEWFAAHAPGDFVYDSVRRRFRLRDEQGLASQEGQSL